MTPETKALIEKEANLHGSQYGEHLGESWGPVEDFKFGAEYGLKLGREEACVLVEALENIASRNGTDDAASVYEMCWALSAKARKALVQYKKSVEES